MTPPGSSEHLPPGRALVVGTGLIGASIGAALRRSGWTVTGWDPSPEAGQAALAMGALDDIAAAVGDGRGVDLVVLAAPVGSIVTILGQLATDALVFDTTNVPLKEVVGTLKAMIQQESVSV